MSYESRSCKGKRRYDSRRDAKRARARIKASGADTKVGHLQPYGPCDFCGYWHLGHLPPLIARGEVDKDEWKWRT